MKVIKIILTGWCCLLLSNAYANESIKPEHFVFHYETGNTYDIKLHETTMTWQGLEGGDTGKTEVEQINRTKLSEDVEVIQWTENNQAFVTVALDRAHLKVVSSGKVGNDVWLAQGTVVKKD